jgi:hypothetical protein
MNLLVIECNRYKDGKLVKVNEVDLLNAKGSYLRKIYFVVACSFEFNNYKPMIRGVQKELIE